MSSPLENEDLDNIPLVRMEDVQPRDRNYIVVARNGNQVSCVIENSDYENECILNNDDSNIGSMVSIHSEEVAYAEDSDEAEMIVPEVLEPALDEIPIEIEEKIQIKSNTPDSWPTLEILPGGVIKRADKCDSELGPNYPGVLEQDAADSGEMMYACAKCSQSFKYLFCLVKHVKWHEDEQKRLKGPDLSKLTHLEREMVYLKRARHNLEKSYKKQKVETLARVAAAIGNIENFKDIFNIKKYKE